MTASTNADALVNLALSHRARGDIAQARALFEETVRNDPAHAPAWHQLGTLLTECFGEFDQAAAALDRALAILPGDKDFMRARGRVEIERGGDAIAWYVKAQASHPDDPDICLDLANARFEARDDDGALADLSTLTAKRPGWINGHAAIALLRWQRGEQSLAQGFEDALARDPSNQALWLACFDALSRAPDYAGMLRCVDRARSTFGEAQFLDRFEAMAASETGNLARADAVFTRMAKANGGVLSDMEMEIAFLRHLLRARRIEDAARFAETLVAKPGGKAAWSYLGTAWRLLGDDRWTWLEGAPSMVATIAMDLDLQGLAAVLRRLHTGRCAPLGQTERGGTKTGGILFNRPEPEIVKLRGVIERCVRRYVDLLPPPDPRHPFLREPRNDLGFTGSWSVRLTGAGYHINHTHPQGWISSAFYVALPDSIGVNEDKPDGWLAFGQPPPELELGLAPARLIKPKAGLLVLFPSTMWHGTVPFHEGERLTVAFDVQSR